MRLETLLTHPAAQALGRSLLHFLWQGSLLAVLLWMIKTIAPRSARVRYAAASLVMLMMPLALIVTIARGVRHEPGGSAPIVASREPTPAVTPLATALSVLSASEPSVGISGWVVCLWGIGVLLLSLRAAGGWMRAQRLKRRVLPASGELEEMMTRLKCRLSISAPVRLYTSAIVQVPTVIGWIRPYLLLPVTTITGLSESQIRAILAHELAHIRRHDYLVNLLQTAIETVLFYHPAVWWVGRQMRIEREHCCDDIAVAVCGNVIEYAAALAELEQLRLRIPEPAIAATGGELLGRIRRLLGQQPSEDRASRSLGAIAAAALVLFIAGVPAVRSLNAAPQQPESVQVPDPPKVQLPDPPKKYIPRPLIAQAQASPPKPAASTAGNSEERAKTVGLLIKLFDEEKDAQMKRAIMAYLAESPDPRARAELQTIVRSDSDPGMRRAALAYFAEQANFDALVSLYDNETNLEMKISILAYIGDSDDPRASDKLLSIVQSDSNVEVRRAALAHLAGR